MQGKREGKGFYRDSLQPEGRGGSAWTVIWG